MHRIYGLAASDEPHHVRYVGQTTMPLGRRLSAHLSLARSGRRSHKDAWIRAVLARGRRVLILELEVNPPDLNFAECRMIAALREAGYRLTNQTDGGEGHRGPRNRPRTPAELAANPARTKAWTQAAAAPEVRARAVASRLAGRPLHPGVECQACGALFSGWPYKFRAKRKTCSWTCKRRLISKQRLAYWRDIIDSTDRRTPCS
jgi:hypothetical protein